MLCNQHRNTIPDINTFGYRPPCLHCAASAYRLRLHKYRSNWGSECNEKRNRPNIRPWNRFAQRFCRQRSNRKRLSLHIMRCRPVLRSNRRGPCSTRRVHDATQPPVVCVPWYNLQTFGLIDNLFLVIDRVWKKYVVPVAVQRRPSENWQVAVPTW